MTYRKVEEESEKENKKDVSEAERVAAKLRETMSLEERTTVFRAMLVEKGVSVSQFIW